MSSQGLPREPLDAALEAVKRLDEALRGSCTQGHELRADAIARRAKDAPQLILQVGLVPTLAFFLSKLDREERRQTYAAALKVIFCEGSCSANICGDLTGEGGGYPHIAALLIAYAGSLAGCAPGDLGVLSHRLVECLERIRGGGMKLERLVASYAEEVKKLATALYEAKESR